MSIESLSGKVFLLITGASQGIGKQIAVSFGSLLEKGSHILLLARNVNALKETAGKIVNDITVDYVSVDLGKAQKDELRGIILQSLKDKKPESFDRLVLVHNVGSIGDISQETNSMTDLKLWHSYYDLNVFLPAVLNGVVLQIFEKTNKKVVINVTSILATVPKKCMAYYCSGKAARKSFFQVFALENPNVDVLNYSPGPVSTDMLNTVCSNVGDNDVKNEFTELRKNNKVLTTEQTVNRLLEVLREHKYKSGDTVDYFDNI